MEFRDPGEWAAGNPRSDNGPGELGVRAIVSFTLPSSGERWNWPIEAGDGLGAFVEILDCAGIRWSVWRA